jgi:hypothetical protein
MSQVVIGTGGWSMSSLFRSNKNGEPINDSDTPVVQSSWNEAAQINPQTTTWYTGNWFDNTATAPNNNGRRLMREIYNNSGQTAIVTEIAVNACANHSGGSQFMASAGLTGPSNGSGFTFNFWVDGYNASGGHIGGTSGSRNVPSASAINASQGWSGGTGVIQVAGPPYTVFGRTDHYSGNRAQQYYGISLNLSIPSGGRLRIYLEAGGIGANSSTIFLDDTIKIIVTPPVALTIDLATNGVGLDFVSVDWSVNTPVTSLSSTILSTAVPHTSGSSGNFSRGGLSPGTQYTISVTASNGLTTDTKSITFTTIDRARITSPASFNLGTNPITVHTNPGGTRVDLQLLNRANGSEIVRWNNIGGSSIAATVERAITLNTSATSSKDIGWDQIYRLMGTGILSLLRWRINTYNYGNATIGWFADLDCTCNITSNHPSVNTHSSGAFRRGIIWRNFAGVWRRCLLWRRVGNNWHRGI